MRKKTLSLLLVLCMALTLLPMSALAADEPTSPSFKSTPVFADAVDGAAVGSYVKMTEVNNWYERSYKADVNNFVSQNSATANVKVELKTAIENDEGIYLVSKSKKDTEGKPVTFTGSLVEDTTYLFSGVASVDTYELKVVKGDKSATASHVFVLKTASVPSVIQSNTTPQAKKTDDLYYSNMKKNKDDDGKYYYQGEFVFSDSNKEADLKISLAEEYRSGDYGFALAKNGTNTTIVGSLTPVYNTNVTFSDVDVPGEYTLLIKKGNQYIKTSNRFILIDNSNYAMELNITPDSNEVVQLVAGHLYKLVKFGKYPPKTLSIKYNGSTPSFIKLLDESGKVVTHNVTGGEKTVTLTATFVNDLGQTITRTLNVKVNIVDPVIAPVNQTVTVGVKKADVFDFDLPAKGDSDYATYRLVKAATNNSNVVLSDNAKGITVKKELIGVDVVFTFYFEDEAYPANKFTVSKTVTITSKPKNASYYLITATAGSHGTVSPKAAKMQGGYFEKQKISIIPDNGYKVADVKVGTDPNNLKSVGALTSYTFRNVKADNYLHATFEKDETQVYYTVTAYAGSHGKVSPESSRVKGLSTVKITITPDTGYKVKDVKVDGYSVGAVTEYTFSKIDANHSLTATFAEAEGYYNIIATSTAGGKVSPEQVRVRKYTSQKVTITPNSGYEIKDVKVDGISVGSVTEYTFSIVQDNHTLVATFGRTKPFADVPATAWYYDEVMYVADRAIMNGVTADTFEPNTVATRGMLVTTLYRIAGEPTVLANSPTFTDVASGSWYENAIRWAAYNGIVGGYGNAKFGPNDPVTREQFVTIFYRYSDMKGYNTNAGSGVNLSAYKDAGEISSYAVTSMKWGIGAGLIEGKGDLKLDPKGQATRAEMATILMRFDINFVK